MAHRDREGKWGVRNTNNAMPLALELTHVYNLMPIPEPAALAIRLNDNRHRPVPVNHSFHNFMEINSIKCMRLTLVTNNEGLALSKIF